MKNEINACHLLKRAEKKDLASLILKDNDTKRINWLSFAAIMRRCDLGAACITIEQESETCECKLDVGELCINIMNNKDLFDDEHEELIQILTQAADYYKNIFILKST